jgi:hypothetical protein
MKELMLTLDEAGFNYDSSESRFIRMGWQDNAIGIQLKEDGLEVSICGCSDEEFTALETFTNVEEAIEFAKGV